MKSSEMQISSLLLSIILFLAASALAGQLQPLGHVPAPAGNPQTTAKIELGKKLFFDRRLSGDGTMSCATCHIPDQAFSDGEAISLNYPTTKNWRNSPTLINIGFQRYLFYDGRAETLERQALFPMMAAFEMNRNLDYLEEEIRRTPSYVEEFEKVFGGEPTREKVAMALASFERSLVSVNAPLDRYLLGDRASLSADAQKGLAVFTGKGKCNECHFGRVLSDSRFHALNVPENPEYADDPGIAVTRRFVAKTVGYKDYRTLREDPGRYLVTRNKKDWKAFRTPSLREVSKTAPYMHNGIFNTLEEVIEFFDSGGGKGNSVLKPLFMTPEEKQYLKVFLVEALTGEDLIIKYPSLP